MEFAAVLATLALIVFAFSYLFIKREMNSPSAAKPEALSPALQKMVVNAIARQDALAELHTFTNKHIDTLWAKRQQLTFTDDYGRENHTRFDLELNYFVSEVMPQPLIERYMASGDHLGDPVDAMKAVVRDRLKWHNRTMNRRRDVLAAEGKLPQTPLVYRPEMSGLEFEQLVKAVFEQQGYLVRETPATGDQGVDLILEKDGTKVVVQCKRSTSAVGNSAVQEAAAGKFHYVADEAWVVSDAIFTLGARTLAQTNSVKLVNFFSL